VGICKADRKAHSRKKSIQRGISVKSFNLINEELDNLNKRIVKISGHFQEFLNSSRGTPSTRKAVKELFKLRKSAYEEMNQIQHAYLNIRAVQIMENKYPSHSIIWHWNPAQTSGGDLVGTVENEILVSAEVTSSNEPKGTIDSHMATTLGKLNMAKGDKLYFVVTSEMEKRAKTKIRKAKYDISVIVIDMTEDATDDP
jgi:hypothetical protein